VETTAELLASEWGGVIPFAGYEMDTPQIWEKYGSEWVEFPLVSGDIYLSLKTFATHRADVPTELAPDALAIVTTGYAAPIDDCVDDDGEHIAAPSESKNRRRLAIAVFVARDASRVSVMRFADEPGETIAERTGSGTLSEAIDLAAVSAWGAEYLARLTILAVDDTNGLSNDERADVRDRVGHLLKSAELLQRVTGDNNDD
jgi:hypothetical protein